MSVPDDIVHIIGRRNITKGIPKGISEELLKEKVAEGVRTLKEFFLSCRMGGYAPSQAAVMVARIQQRLFYIPPEPVPIEPLYEIAERVRKEKITPLEKRIVRDSRIYFNKELCLRCLKKKISEEFEKRGVKAFTFDMEQFEQDWSTGVLYCFGRKNPMVLGTYPRKSCRFKGEQTSYMDRLLSK